MRVLYLDILQEGLPGITPKMGAFYMEAAIVGLVKSGHQSGVVLKIAGAINTEFKIVWTAEMTANILNSWQEERVYVSHGAVGIAICLFSELFGFTFFEEGRYGTGIDFWLGKGELDRTSISASQREARMEVSGILKESKSNTLTMRMGKKKSQMLASDGSKLPGWVVVI